MESVQRIRELEKSIIDDPKKANSILTIKEYLIDEKKPSEARMASLHALRRIFIDSIDSGRFNVSDTKNAELVKYNKWLKSQLSSYQQSLLNFISKQEEPFHAPAIRTLLEVILPYLTANIYFNVMLLCLL